MYLKDIRTVEIEIIDKEDTNKIIYSGMADDVPLNLKEKEVNVIKQEGKKIVMEIIND